MARNNVHDIRDYGAKVDGSTDDQPAIKAACDAAGAGMAGTVYIPRGTTIVGSTGVTLSSSHNGITITGEGYGSHLKAQGGQSSNYKIFRLDDGTTPVENITIEKCRFDGNRVNDGGAANAWGVITADRGLDTIGNTVRECSAHSWITTGFTDNQGGTVFEECSAWDNNAQGFVFDSTATIPSYGQNLTAWNNDLRGIDMSSGRVGIQGFYCYNNAGGGMKTSTDLEYAWITDGFLVGNSKNGFSQTGASDTLFMDNVVSSGHPDQGFRFANPGTRVKVGSILSDGDNTGGTVAGSVVFGDGECMADYVEVRGGGDSGVYAAANNVQIDTLHAYNNAQYGADISGGTVTINGGYIADNSTYGIASIGTNDVTIKDMTFADTASGNAQSTAFYLDGGSFKAVNLRMGGQGYNRNAGGTLKAYNCDNIDAADATANIWVDDHAATSLAGAAPTATNYEVGMKVADTDNAGDVYYIYDDTVSGGATQIGT